MKLRSIRTYFFQFLRLFFYTLADSFAFLIPSKSNEKKILIIRPDGIGDYIVFLDALSNIREIYPSSKYSITVLCNEYLKVLAENDPKVDHVIPINRGKIVDNLVYRFGVLVGIRKGNFGIVLHPLYNRDIFRGDLLARISAAEIKVSFFANQNGRLPWQNKLTDSWYTSLVDPGAEFQMELQRNTDFVNSLSVEQFQERLPVIQLKNAAPPPSIVRGKKYFVIFPGSGWIKRNWPLSNFMQLAKKIMRQTGLELVVCGGPGENFLSSQLLDYQGINFIDLIGKTDLIELTQVISQADFLISNDTAATHLASATSTLSFCIVGGGNFGRFLPYKLRKSNANIGPVVINEKMDCYHCSWECTQEDISLAVPCIEKISVDKAYDIINHKLNSERECLPK